MVRSVSNPPAVIFISHMVQMKVGIKRIFANLKSSFISHMVQMKAETQSTKHIACAIFISHMVQMKGWNHFSSYCIKDKLYIPHGSDESFTDTETVCSCNSFISHMVQMKAGPMEQRGAVGVYFISHMVQMKATILSYTRSCKSLYIPHGSDERISLTSFPNILPFTLYPTWFR